MKRNCGKIKLDVKSKDCRQIRLKQMDTTQLDFELYDDGQLITLTDLTAEYVFTKPNGTIVEASATLNNSTHTVTAVLSADCVRLHGKGQIEILLKENNEILSTFQLEAIIEKSGKDNVHSNNTPNYIERIESAATEVENLDLDVDKSGKRTTVTLTRRNGTTKTVHIDDGIDLMFNWDETKLGIKTENQENYTYVELKGSKGDTGNPGVGIQSIEKTDTSGLVDTYTITLTNNTTVTFTVTNGQNCEVTKAEVDDLKLRVSVLEGNTHTEDLTWEDIQKIVDNDLVSKYFSIGDEFTEDWKSTKSGVETAFADTPMNFVHNGVVELQNGNTRKSMILEWKYGIPEAVPFCAPQALQCFDGTGGAPDGLPAGNYYFTIAALPNWADARAAYVGKYLCFTLANAIPSGGVLVGSGWGNNATWKIASKSSHLNNATTIETVNITAENSAPSGYTNLGECWGTDVGYGKLNHPESVAYGDNTWRDSDLRQWLNSDETDWWTKITRYNIQPSVATTLKGFLSGYDSSFVNKLKTIKVATYTNTTKEAEGLVYTYDKIFLHSPCERNSTTDNSAQYSGDNPEGEIWDYYKQLANGQSGLDSSGRFKSGSTYPILIRYQLNSQTSAVSIFSRSPRRGYAGSVYYVGASGVVSTSSAPSAYRCLPACVI